MIDKATIDVKMHRLEEIIEYKFKDINNLSKAMFAKKLSISTNGKNNNEHASDALATVGDCLLKAILAIDIYSSEKSSRGSITTEKSELEKNEVLFDVADKYEIFKFAYHETHFFEEAPEHLRVTNSKHNQYIEAIIGAIFFDRGFNSAKKWVLDWLKPKLKYFKKT